MILFDLASPTLKEFWGKTFTDPAIFWVFITGIATIALVLVGYFQLADLVRTRKSELLQKLQERFFNPEAETLLRLMMRNRLVFRNPTFFDVVARQNELIDGVEIEIDFTQQRIFASEIVKLILRPLEYVALLERKKSVLLDELALHFGPAIRICWENDEVRKYIHHIRAQRSSPSLFQELERLATELKNRRLRITI